MSFERNNLQNKKRKWTPLVAIFLIILFFTIIPIKIRYNNFVENPEIPENIQITIKKWDSLNNLWEKIKELDNSFYRIYLSNNTPDLVLKEWIYEIKKGSSIKEIFESLKKPINTSSNFTILEGRNIYEIDKVLTQKWLISKWEYISYVTDKTKIDSWKKYFEFLNIDNLESLEWYLYPDTYRIDTKNFKINNLVQKQLEEFENQVYKKIFKWKYNNETIYDVINLASIVEKEESLIKENQATVAWILKKRLNANWQIWADATVCYAYQIPTSECTQKVVNKYVYEKNEYNTRTKTWLPKTPIANPSYTTIYNTLNDNKTEYWYYLHNLTTGKIYYAKTNQEHEYNKANFMR